MTEDEIDRVGMALTDARRRDVRASAAFDLRRIASADEASAIQIAASLASEEPTIGHAFAATTPATARWLGCEEPVVGPIFAEDRFVDGATLAVSPSMLGIGAQLAFVFGRSFPQDEAEEADPTLVAGAVHGCRLALQVVGRRAPPDTPLNDWTATADFGLSRAYVEGPMVTGWRERLDAEIAVSMRLDGHVQASGRADDIAGGPLAALALLAERLSAQGGCIEAGAVVATGSLTGFVQIIAGQRVIGDFGDLGRVELQLA